MPLDDVFLNIVSPTISKSMASLATPSQVANSSPTSSLPLLGTPSGSQSKDSKRLETSKPIPTNLSKSSRQGAWVKPLPILATRQVVNEVVVRESFTASQKQMDRMEDNLRFPWAAKMDPASRNLFRASEPEYLPDGTPKVTIPQHVLLQGLENHKEYVLGQFYRCLPPPGGLIFAVFNKLWGRKCRITIRKLGESSYLFHIPDESTRSWVIQRGLWHVDDCLMFVASWTPEATLAIPEIKTIPVWVTLKKIPNSLYSIAGISHIASGLGVPMATHKPRLDPILMGEAKILVEVELSKAFPTKIAASDIAGFISMVDVEYAWLPTICSTCGQLGHKDKRCLREVTVSQVSANTITEVTTEKDAEVGNGSAPSSAPVATFHYTTPISASCMKVPITSTYLLQGKESLSSDQTTATIVEEHTISANVSTIEKIPISTTFPPTFVSIESPLQRTAQSSVTAHAPVNATVHRERAKSADHNLGSNQFASLVSSDEEEDLSDSDNESDSMDLMTPSGKRILRERPVKPSTKAKEMHGQTTSRGRGRGRGKRGGRG
ncbi:unnamed protein product [Arabidopsis arenosa]|uniref:DUF4283 domain-containing protein n=1 Tax=Arabidopsis arenosa TaxID=38785 RepID=A0A8S1ZJE8_ARAAE|nr:unnamed protein product [Arabidopsis arenosa]